MEQCSSYSLLPTDTKNVANQKKSRLGIAMMLAGCAALASTHTYAATIGFIQPERPDPRGHSYTYVSHPDSAIVNIGVRLVAGGENWQGSCTIKGDLLGRGAPDLSGSQISFPAIEGLHYRLLTATSFSLTTIPSLDGSGNFQPVQQDILVEVLQGPLFGDGVIVQFNIENLEAKCGDIDVTDDLELADGHNYGGSVYITDSFNQPALVENSGVPRFLAAATRRNSAARLKI